MRPPSPRSLLVEHPALPQPFAAAGSMASMVPVGSLDHMDRQRAAVQLAAVSALLADFELWPGRWAIRRAMAVVSENGPRVCLPSLPVPLSLIWSRLGGGDLAAERTRAAVLDTIAEVTGVEKESLDGSESHAGFFLDGAVTALLGGLDRPLDGATARSLWMLQWSLPPRPEAGDTKLLAISDQTLAKRVASAMWAAAVRRGDPASLEISSGDGVVDLVAGDRNGGGLRILAGSFDDRTLASVMDRSGEPERSAVALGEFPAGWNPAPAPVFDTDHLAAHLSVTGLSPARRLSWLEDRNGRFDPFSRADRRFLTASAMQVFAGSHRPARGRYRRLLRVASLSPEGVPVRRALELADLGEDDLASACRESLVVVRGERLVVPEPAPMTADPRHLELVELYTRDDPRRQLHRALADGNTGELLTWARSRLDDLDSVAVRRLLAGLKPGALGPGIQVALAEACLSLADIHGARRALTGLNDEAARPWSNWLRLMDRPPELEVEFPSATDIRHAPRASAEIALVSVRRALWWENESAEKPVNLVRAALPYLDGMARRWVEIKLTALVDPGSLDDAGWRREATGGRPELMGLVLFERSLRATFDQQFKRASRLLRRVMSAERAPGRLASMQVNLGALEADMGHPRVAEVLTLGAFRLFQTAGFRHRQWDALHNLAVMDIDQLRVDRAKSRLHAVAEAEHTLFVEIERARLALASGDLEAFRSRLARLPAVDDLSSPQIKRALSLLYGVEALFEDSSRAAAPLLRTGGDEGFDWLDLVDAIDQTDNAPASSTGDDWGIRLAARLVRAGRECRTNRELDELVGDPPSLREALAVVLCVVFGCRPGWPGRSLRTRAAIVLAGRGLTGWAALARWGSPDVETVFQRFAELTAHHDSDREINGIIEGVLTHIGLTGLVVRSADGDRELLRVGTGPAADGEFLGSLEIIPLGSEPIRGSAWTLLGSLLEMLLPSGGDDTCESDRTEVRFDGSSPAVERLRRDVLLHAEAGFAVLIQGETGSGKEVVARELHRLSGRTGELVSVNIAAIPGNLLEAELFGSVKGAFTGADRSRGGLVAAANGGTLFLDEVGDLDLALQVKLLRFLESGEIRQVGSDRTSEIDVRVVCATHRNLERRVREGRFRRDLFYRMAVAKIRVPPLRERLDDIPVLRSIFETEAAHRHGLKVSKWSLTAERRLLSHRWPGNVRELKHTVEVAMARAAGGAIRPEHLPLTEEPTVLRGTWESVLGDFKRRFLGEVLSRHRGNRSAAARELGITRQALLYQLKKLDLTDI